MTYTCQEKYRGLLNSDYYHVVVMGTIFSGVVIYQMKKLKVLESIIKTKMAVWPESSGPS
jgi:hypothetical protein